MKAFWNNITFANPELLYLLLIIPLLAGWQWWRYKQRYPELKISTLGNLASTGTSLRAKLKILPIALRGIAIAMIILALARPQSSLSEEKITTEGIDIVMAMDVSSSMLAEDLRPNRLEASKKVAATFIDERQNDRIGLIVFAGESFTQCPITTDHAVIKNLLKDVKSGIIEDGTAIGMGLANAVNRLKESEAKSKVVILLTDGDNNSGFIDPVTAAETAIQFDIRVYTIGLGSRGEAPYPVQTPYGIQYQNIEANIDEPLMQNIAEMTNGKYFRATSNKALTDIYSEIDQLEKTKIEVSAYSRKSEKFYPFAIITGLLLGLEALLSYTIFKSIP